MRLVILSILLCLSPLAYAQRTPPPASSATIQDAAKAISEARFDVAEQAATAVLRKDPGNAHAFLIRAVARLETKRYTEAESDATSAIRLDAELTQAWLVKSEAQKRRNANEEAVLTLKQAQQRFPKSDQPYTALGILYAQLGKCGDAVLPLEEALVRRPDNYPATRQLAQCYLRLKRLAAAECRSG